ncbi:hypothetical protein OAO87_03645, partial [bacterium]|nr:hypothetical protein [bacterium]
LTASRSAAAPKHPPSEAPAARRCRRLPHQSPRQRSEIGQRGHRLPSSRPQQLAAAAASAAQSRSGRRPLVRSLVVALPGEVGSTLLARGLPSGPPCEAAADFFRKLPRKLEPAPVEVMSWPFGARRSCPAGRGRVPSGRTSACHVYVYGKPCQAQPRFGWFGARKSWVCVRGGGSGRGANGEFNSF